MRFFRRAAGSPKTVAVLSGAFHPVTNAHLALACTALESGAADEVLLVLPEAFPHKSYGAVSLEQRLEMLAASVTGVNGLSIGISEGGLFLEIARECRALYRGEIRLRFLCGRDAAERILAWNYDELPAIEDQLREYELLVAPRKGHVQAPAHLEHAIHSLAVNGDFDDVSSSEVRQRIARGEPWRHLVPERIHRLVEAWYP